MSEMFAHRLRVRYSECDQQGVVFNGHYLFFYDVGVTELFRDRFGSYRNLLDRGLDLMVAEVRLKFLAPARFDDEVDLHLPIERLGTTSMIIRPRFLVGDRVIAEGEAVHVFVDTSTQRKTPIPQDIRDRLC